jgi:hypothetical protein
MSGREPSPALLISLIALFVALGGTGYAAVKVNGKNIKNASISGKKLKSRTITGKKIKKNSIGAQEVNESKFGKVGSAATADSAATAGAAANASALGGLPPDAFERAGHITSAAVVLQTASAGTPILHDPRTGADVRIVNTQGKLSIANTSTSLPLQVAGVATRLSAGAPETKLALVEPGAAATIDYGGTEGPNFIDLAVALYGHTAAETRYSHLTCSTFFGGSAENLPSMVSCAAVG